MIVNSFRSTGVFFFANSSYSGCDKQAKPCPAGPPGLQGPPGANGENGKDGQNGENGKSGAEIMQVSGNLSIL